MTDKALLVVDSDRQRQQHVKELLETLNGGPIHLATPDEWQGQVKTDEASGVALIGPCPDAAGQIRFYDALRERAPHLAVILYSDAGDPVRLDPARMDGAFVRTLDFPIRPAALSEALQQALVHAAANGAAGKRDPELFRSLVGKSEGIRQVRHLIARVAKTDTTVLLLGESGTGKEVVARNLHYHSPRRGRPFVAVNCGAIPAELLESELFGHEKGAFTGAVAARQGRFEIAAGGTLFLDEIGELSLAMQVKLLRVIQERVFERVGGNRSLRADVRLIAATHRDLEHEVRQKRFRDDLYYRLNVFPIHMPPLRDRTEDIPLLVTELIARLRQERGAVARFSPAAMHTLQQCVWPGNVRELANLVERLTILHGEGIVDVPDLPAPYQAAKPVRESVVETAEGAVMPLPDLPAAGLDLKEYLANVEYGLITQALTRTGGVVAHAAQLLKLRRTTLVEKLHKYGVRRESTREGESPPPTLHGS